MVKDVRTLPRDGGGDGHVHEDLPNHNREGEHVHLLVVEAPQQHLGGSLYAAFKVFKVIALNPIIT